MEPSLTLQTALIHSTSGQLPFSPAMRDFTGWVTRCDHVVGMGPVSWETGMEPIRCAKVLIDYYNEFFFCKFKNETKIYRIAQNLYCMEISEEL